MIRLNIKRFASGEILLSLQHSSSSVTFQGKVVWSSTVVSGTNTSNVTAKLYARKQGSSSATSGSKWTGYVTINGTQNNYSTGSLSVSNNWKLIYTAPTVPVTHGSDGSKSITIAGSVKGPSGTTLANITSSGSDTVVLDTIKRQSALSSVAVNITTINGNTTVTVTPQGTKYVDDYYDSLTLTANNQNIVLNDITFGTAKTLTDAQKTTLWNMFGDNRSVVISAYVITKTSPSGTTVGYSSTITTVADLPFYGPSLSYGWYDSNDDYDNYKNDIYNDIITGLSLPTFTFSSNSSTGDWYGKPATFTVTTGSNIYEDATSPLIIEDSRGLEGPVVITATSRGETSSVTLSTLNFIPYATPGSLPLQRGRVTPTSQNLLFSCSAQYYDGDGLKSSALASDIVITASYKVGDSGTETVIPQSSFTRISHSVTDHRVLDQYSVTVDTGGVLDYQKPTYVTYSITDLLGVSTVTKTITIPAGEPLWYGYNDSSYKQYMIINGALTVDNKLGVTKNATFDKNIFTNTFEFGDIKNHVLPDGNLLSGSYWCSIPNGHYWIGSSGSYTNSPVTYGFVDKTGFYITDGTIQDYNVVIYSAGDGPVYRLNNNATSTNTWRRIDGGATEMTYGLSSNQSVTATTMTKISLGSSTIIGTGLSTSSNGIKIGPGIKYVEVSAVMQFSAYSGTALRRCCIQKNYVSTSSTGTTLAQACIRPTGTYESVTIPPKLVSVQENDIIYLCLFSDSNSQTVYGQAAQTYLTVKVVN